MRLHILAALVAAPLLAHAVACTKSSPMDADPFDTFQLCYDEHHHTESLPVQHTIEICCIDHPIGGVMPNMVCGDTAAACTAYVTANLTDAADATLTSDISAACDAYVVDRAG